MATVHSFDPGCMIGEYEVLKNVGKNAAGEVYLVRHQTNNRAYALKTIFSEQLCSDPQWHDRFVQNRKLVSGIHHRNLVENVDCFRVEEFQMSCVVTEFLPNGSLLEYLSQHPESNTMTFVLAVVEAVVSALAEIDKNHLVHGNITPTNILLTEDNQVKLAELGIIKSPDCGSDLLSRFTAPELLDNEKGDIRSDFYSLGMVLYLMTAGQLPFHAEEFFQRLAAEGLPEPKSFCPFMHPAVNDFIVRLTALNPADRPQSIDELREQVVLLKSGKSVSMPEKAAAPSVPKNAPSFLKKGPVPPAPVSFHPAKAENPKVGSSVQTPIAVSAPVPVPTAVPKISTPAAESGDREDELIVDETKMRQIQVPKFSWDQLPSLMLAFFKEFSAALRSSFLFLKSAVVQCVILCVLFSFGIRHLSTFAGEFWKQQEQAAIAQYKLNHHPDKTEVNDLKRLLAQDGQWAALQWSASREDCGRCIEQLKKQKDPDALVLAATLMMLQQGKSYSEKEFLPLLEQAAAAGSREAAGFLRDWYEAGDERQKAQTYRQMLNSDLK